MAVAVRRQAVVAEVLLQVDNRSPAFQQILQLPAPQIVHYHDLMSSRAQALDQI